MRYLAKLSSKGQLTIPQEVRRLLGVKQGDQLSFEVENDLLVVRPFRAEENPFLEFRAALGSFETADEINDWISKMRDDG